MAHSLLGRRFVPCGRRRRNNPWVRQAVLLDLDETLIEEEAAARDAYEATAELAQARTDEDVNPGALVADVRAIARERWQRSPSSDYCTDIGISSTEGLGVDSKATSPDFA